MSDSGFTPEVDEEIAELRAKRAAAEKQVKQLQRTERVMTPVWDRLGLRRVQNSLGREYDLSMTPRERAS